MDRPDARRIFTETLIRYMPEAAGYIVQPDAIPGDASIRSIAAVHPGGDKFLADLEEQFTAPSQAGEAE
ncbi:hypothetical protein ABZZ74_30710 [Streptomyces sp. NPDC006476]|uniref:hypothetical protein n=1 Tax=Streptomyces sp. NPDC006476 TaxID=3157175 RepID=UPI0033BD657C